MRVKEVIEFPEFLGLIQTDICKKAPMHCGLSHPIWLSKTQPETEILSAEQQDQSIKLAKNVKRQKLLAKIQQSQRSKAANDASQADVEQAWLDATFYQPRNSSL